MTTIKKFTMNGKLVLAVLTAVTAIVVTSCGAAVSTTATATTSASGTVAPTTATSAGAATTTPSGAPSQTSTTVAGIRKKITPQEGKDLLAKTPGAILLDVRTEEEYKELRIPGSVLIPVAELPDRLSELPKDPAKPIVIYCRSGNRSATAAGILVKAGFPVVYDMGGIIDWPFETEKG